MVELIGFPDAEAVAITLLKSQLSARGVAAKVATKVPTPRPDLLVRVSRVGGVSRDIVTDSATLLIECSGLTEIAASDLASLARAIMLAAARLTPNVTRAVDGGGIVSLSDPDTNSPRYQFVVQLDLRGTTV